MRELFFYLETTDGEVFELGKQIPKLKHQQKADDLLIRHMDYAEFENDEEGEPLGTFRIFCIAPEGSQLTSQGRGVLIKLEPSRIAREMACVNLSDMAVIVKAFEDRFKAELAEGDPDDGDDGETQIDPNIQPAMGPGSGPRPEVTSGQAAATTPQPSAL